MRNYWHTVGSREDIDDYWRGFRTDPGFAQRSQRFWASRKPSQLRQLANGAWLANDPDTYWLARSYANV